ncbi:esterase-like activity of phytase family protein [Myxococcota bacterium]|nr:esterase-like activity of phytase family protein [Myxococcota bacterium]
MLGNRIHKRVRYLIIGASLMALGACSTKSPEEPDTKPVSAWAIETISISMNDVMGLSGVSRDSEGRLWAIAERDPRILIFSPDGKSIQKTLSVQGVPEGSDTEAIVLLSDKTALVGTESMKEARTYEELFLSEIDSETLKLNKKIELPYAAFGVTGTPNHGIEGLCLAGEHILVASETIIEEGGARYAPLWILNQKELKPRAIKLRLQTKTGKISALYCEKEGDEILLYAIERDYGVGRILKAKFKVNAKRIEPEVVTSLETLIKSLPNCEGILPMKNGDFYLLVDNHTGKKTGPNQWLRLYKKP